MTPPGHVLNAKEFEPNRTARALTLRAAVARRIAFGHPRGAGARRTELPGNHAT